jgi:hypothetical protein
MPHVDEGQLHALLDDALAQDEALALHEHARNCAQCAARLDQARALRARAAALLATAQPSRAGIPAFETVLERAQRSPAARSAWAPSTSSLARAATIILALGIGWFSHDLTQRAAVRDQVPQAGAERSARASPPVSNRPAAPGEGKVADSVTPASADEKKENQAVAPPSVPAAEPAGRELQRDAQRVGAAAAESETALRKSTAASNVSGQTQAQSQLQIQMQRQAQQRLAPRQDQVAAAPPAAAQAGQRAFVDAATSTPQWQFVALGRAEQLIGRRVLRVPDLEVINVGLAQEAGSQLVLTRQRLPDQGVLELLHRRQPGSPSELTMGVTEARRARAESNESQAKLDADDLGGALLTMQRPDGTLTARAFLAPDSLRTLLLRVQ